MDRAGSAGGRATLAKHGREWMAEIGRRGFTSFCNRWFDGDREAAGTWLRARAAEHTPHTHAERVLQERMAAGEKVASVELPIYDAGEDGIPF